VLSLLVPLVVLVINDLIALDRFLIVSVIVVVVVVAVAEVAVSTSSGASSEQFDKLCWSHR